MIRQGEIKLFLDILFCRFIGSCELEAEKLGM